MASKTDLRSRILKAIDAQLRSTGAGSLTIEQVAKEAGCAKGLISYHFKSKELLLAAAAEQMLADREERWNQALSGVSVQEAIHRSWSLILADTDNGFWKAHAGLVAIDDELTGQPVKMETEKFAILLATLIGRLLRGMGARSSITDDELGHLLSASIQGFGMQLLSGVPTHKVESAYTALWLAVISLTENQSR